MKPIRNLSMCLAAMLLAVPWAQAQDLSKYRQFSLGASLAEVSKQIDQRPDNASMIQQDPATIQQLEWWPVPVNLLAKSEPVQKVTLSFYNRALYKVEAMYDSDATAGLTAADMIRAISASYGTATKVNDIVPHSGAAYDAVSPAIAEWEDGRYIVSLSRESF